MYVAPNSIDEFAQEFPKKTFPKVKLQFAWLNNNKDVSLGFGAPNPTQESCNWFNAVFSELWRHMSQSVSETTRTKLKELLEYSMNQKKPPAVVCYSLVTEVTAFRKV